MWSKIKELYIRFFGDWRVFIQFQTYYMLIGIGYAFAFFFILPFPLWLFILSSLIGCYILLNQWHIRNRYFEIYLKDRICWVCNSHMSFRDFRIVCKDNKINIFTALKLWDCDNIVQILCCGCFDDLKNRDKLQYMRVENNYGFLELNNYFNSLYCLEFLHCNFSNEMMSMLLWESKKETDKREIRDV